MRTLGNTDTKGFIKAKDNKFGAVMFCIMLNSPNINPIDIPTIGPPIMEPTITGMCIMVALAPGSGIKP